MEMIRVSIGVLAVFIIIMLLVLICLAFYIAVQYEKKKALITRKNEYLNELSSVWHDYLVKSKEADLAKLKPSNKEEYEITEKILLCYVKNLSNSEILLKIKGFANEFLTDYYALLLRSRKWSLRMNALYRTADFKLETLIEECHLLEQRKCTPEEIHQIYKIYSIMDFDSLVEKLQANKDTFTEIEYSRLLTFISDKDLNHMVTLFEEFPYKCQLAIVNALGHRRLQEYVSFFEKLILHTDPEMRLRSLKAIFETGWVIDIEKYLHFVHSDIWEERLHVTKLLGRLPLEDSYSYLQKLLKDQSWKVRSEAANTIGKIKDGKKMLIEFVDTSSDRYAIEIANEIIRKGT